MRLYVYLASSFGGKPVPPGRLLAGAHRPLTASAFLLREKSLPPNGKDQIRFTARRRDGENQSGLAVRARSHFDR